MRSLCPLRTEQRAATELFSAMNDARAEFRAGRNDPGVFGVAGFSVSQLERGRPRLGSAEAAGGSEAQCGSCCLEFDAYLTRKKWDAKRETEHRWTSLFALSVMFLSALATSRPCHMATSIAHTLRPIRCPYFARRWSERVDGTGTIFDLDDHRRFGHS